MKSTTLNVIAFLGLAASAFAGHEMAPTGKDYKSVPAEPCFKDREVQVDVFGSWIDTRSAGSGWGGGVAVNYFFHRYFGFGIDGNLADVNNGLWTTSGSLIARYPLELGSICIAPYAIGGAGIQADGTTTGCWHAGAGLEWRATPSFGVFTEGRYIWTAGAGSEENVRISLGARFIF